MSTAQLAAVSFLARYSGRTHALYTYQAGVEVTWDAEFPGHDRFYAADPFGNRVEFLEPQS